MAAIPLPLVPKPLVFSPFPLGLRHPRTPQGVGHGAQVKGAGGLGFSSANASINLDAIALSLNLPALRMVETPNKNLGITMFYSKIKNCAHE